LDLSSLMTYMAVLTGVSITHCRINEKRLDNVKKTQNN
jgi:hypothetical protein